MDLAADPVEMVAHEKWRTIIGASLRLPKDVRLGDVASAAGAYSQDRCILSSARSHGIDNAVPHYGRRARKQAHHTFAGPKPLAGVRIKADQHVGGIKDDFAFAVLKSHEHRRGPAFIGE